MERSIEQLVKQDLIKKMVVLTGPRQCGKTTLAQQITQNFDYLNYDSDEDRLALKDKKWRRDVELLIFDELHKMQNWKRWLKGVYDTESKPPAIIVTGSAKLNTYRKVGDSLAGRYFRYHLHPLDLKEACQYWKEDKQAIFDRLLTVSGFPEPFLAGEHNYYRRWRKTHLDVILKQDLLDFHSARHIKSIETLIVLLKQRVGSTISYANLARDLDTDIHTIKRWLSWLEEFYVIFKVTPYHRNIARSLLKEPKYYFYDTAIVEGNHGEQLENIVACAILKELHWLEDTTGINIHLHFLRTKEGREIDFAVAMDNKITHLIEVKWADDSYSKAFDYFARYVPDAKKIQLVYQLKRESSYPNGVQIKAALPWLANISLSLEGKSGQ